MAAKSLSAVLAGSCCGRTALRWAQQCAVMHCAVQCGAGLCAGQGTSGASGFGRGVCRGSFYRVRCPGSTEKFGRQNHPGGFEPRTPRAPGWSEHEPLSMMKCKVFLKVTLARRREGIFWSWVRRVASVGGKRQNFHEHPPLKPKKIPLFLDGILPRNFQKVTDKNFHVPPLWDPVFPH